MLDGNFFSGTLLMSFQWLQEAIIIKKGNEDLLKFPFTWDWFIVHYIW